MMIVFGWYIYLSRGKAPYRPASFPWQVLFARVYAKKWQFSLDKGPGLKASRTNFSTRKLARVYVQQGRLDKRIFVYVPNSCGLVKAVKKKYCQISRTQEQTKPAKESLSRKNCSSYRRAWVKSWRNLSRKTCSSVRGLSVWQPESNYGK